MNNCKFWQDAQHQETQLGTQGTVFSLQQQDQPFYDLPTHNQCSRRV